MPIIHLFENILAGTRTALFLPIRLWSFKGDFLQICLLLIVSLSLSLLYDYYDTAPDNYFNPYGLSYQSLLYLSFFFSLALISVLNSRQRDLGKLIILFLSIVPIIWLGSVCLLTIAEHQTYLDEYQSNWVVFITYSIWYLLVVARLIKRYFYLSVLPTIAYVFLYALFNFSPLFLLPTEPLWYPLQTSNQNVTLPSKVDVEKIYYSQNTLLNENINNLIGGNEGITDLFFIGFAGDADEDVFMNETNSAKAIMDDRFNTFGRSLVLINNSKTVENIPLANGHNLKTSIKKIAELMNTDEDILVLFLTSHGSEDHYLSANFPPFKLNNLNGDTINNALSATDIKWRIIIISACYSGGFIKSISDPYSLIITAANSKQNSFGCGHDGQYTYFGEAYLEQGLKQTGSFIEAFQVAKKVIMEKENNNGFENSDPQIMIGSEIENKLIKFEK
ncbi:MAG: C13 family peptidase [Pseudomonadota bacterium]